MESEHAVLTTISPESIKHFEMLHSPVFCRPQKPMQYILGSSPFPVIDRGHP